MAPLPMQSGHCCYEHRRAERHAVTRSFDGEFLPPGGFAPIERPEPRTYPKVTIKEGRNRRPGKARKRKGYFDMIPLKILANRLWVHVSFAHTGCWIWTGYKLPNGYGVLSLYGVAHLVHRLVYCQYVERLGHRNLQIDHLCRQRNCVNPIHMEPVTLSENVRRGHSWAGLNRRKTHCPSGHAYAGSNLILKAKGRYCRECCRLSVKRWREGKVRAKA